MKFKKSSLKKFAIISFIAVLTLALTMYVIAQSNFEQKSFVSDDRIWLVKGWNLISVFQTFVGKSLNELAHTGQGPEICVDPAPNVAGWLFNNTGKDFIIMQNFGKTIAPIFEPTERFSQDHVWSSVWIKIENNCALGCGSATCMTGSR